MKAAHYTNDEIQQIAAVNEADVEIARDMWRRYSLPLFRDLIDAPLYGSGERARIAWDARTRRYIYTANGYRIPPIEIRNRIIEPFLANVRFAMRFVSARLQSGEITLIEWQREMYNLTKYSQLAAALIANGGARNSTQTDYAAIAALILALLLFLQAFVLDIETGKQLLNGTLLTRGDLYANAGRDAYEEMGRYGERLYLGSTMERRVLDPGAHHCHTIDDWTGCPELAELGWRPIGTLPRLYDTPCRTNCRCHFEYQ